MWARLDSNQRPTDYESAALTTELRAHRKPSPHDVQRSRRHRSDRCRSSPTDLTRRTKPVRCPWVVT